MWVSLRCNGTHTAGRLNRTVLTGLALALALSGCSTNDRTRVELSPSDDKILYVIERGWHTDIGLPVDEITGLLTKLERPFPGVRFLTFGFGERQFLITRQVSLLTMLAALLPSRSALLMTALSTSPEVAFGQQNVVALHVSQASLQGIENRIWDELEQSPTGDPIWLADGPYPGSVFYAARDTYDGFYTCNTWTAAMMRSGGVPMSTTGILFAGQVMGMARWITRADAVTARRAASRSSCCAPGAAGHCC
jgi:uncharacterized protein (TIGR02117 family)